MTEGLLEARAEDIISGDIATQNITYDRTPPVIQSFSGPSTNLTRTGPVEFTITYSGHDNINLSSGDVSLIHDPAVTVGSVTISTLDPNTRKITLDAISGDGSLQINVQAGTATDNAGNPPAGSSGPSSSITVDNTPPDIATNLEVDSNSDMGISNSDGLTNDDAPVINGVGEPNAEVFLTSDTDGALSAGSSVFVDGLGNWSFPVSSNLSEGMHIITAILEDPAGNQSLVSDPLVVEIDVTPPNILNAELLDVNDDGPIDQAVIYLDEPIFDQSVNASEYQLESGESFLFSINDGGPDDQVITLGGVFDGTAILELDYLGNSTADWAGNLVLSDNAITSTNNKAPAIFFAGVFDNDLNGHIETIVIVTDEPIKDDLSNLNVSNFVVDGYLVTAVTSDIPDDLEISLTVQEKSDFDTDVTPDVTVLPGTLTDVDGNSLNSNLVFSDTEDYAPPFFISGPDINQTSFSASENIVLSGTLSERTTEASLNLLGIGGPSFISIFPTDNMDGTYSFISNIGTANSYTQGLGNITFKFVDLAFNSNESGNVILQIDKLVPSISINKLETSSTSNIVLDGNVSSNGDNDLSDLTFSISLDGSLLASNQPVNAIDNTWEYTIVGPLAEGFHDIDATIHDLFGNSSSNLNDSDSELKIGGAYFTEPVTPSLCIGAEAKPLGSITLTELKADDFKEVVNGTFFLTLPDDFEFEISKIPDFSMSTFFDITSVTISYIGKKALRVEIDVANTESGLDELIIDNIEVKAVAGLVSNQPIEFSNGTASIFDLTNGTPVAHLTSLATPAPPTIKRGSIAGPILANFDVAVGSNSETLFADGAGATFSWYDWDGNELSTVQAPTLGDLSGTNLSATGFDIDTPGVYTIFASTKNSDGCESALQKVIVYVRDIALDPFKTNFVETDQVPVVISVANDIADFQLTFSGPGLTNIDEDSNPAVASFYPNVAGAGDHFVKATIVNKYSFDEFEMVMPFSVTPEQNIFSNTSQEDFCKESISVQLNAFVSDVPNGYHFYGLRMGEVGGLLDDGLLTPPADWDNITPITANKSTNGWSFNPSTLTGLEYEIVRWIVPTNSVDPLNPDVGSAFGTANVHINPLPEVSFSSSEGSYVCEDDQPFELYATVNNTPVNIDSYEVTDQLLFDSKVINSNLFDPSDPMGDGSFRTGEFVITYVSDPLDDPLENGCVNTANSITINVLQSPTSRTLDLTGDLLAGRGELVGDTYVFEYCEGESFDNLSIALNANEHVNWYTSASLVSEIEITNGNVDGSFVTPEDLIGYTTAQGGENEDFYFVITNNANLEGGCTSEALKVQIIGYDQPEIPTVDLTSSVSGGTVEEGKYEFNYCTTSEATIETLSLETLPNDGESYYRLLDDQGKILQDKVVGATIDLSIEMSSHTPGTSMEFGVQKILHDNTFPISEPLEGRAFVGCESAVTSVVINIHGVPSAPELSEFRGDAITADDIITYYMCQGEKFPDLGINAPLGLSEFVYEWYEDENLTDPITLSSLEGDRVTAQDLSDESFSFDVNTPGTYDMYVKLNSNIREDAGFVGCESSLTKVRIIVFEKAGKPQVLAPGKTQDATLSGGYDYAYDFCVDAETGLLENETFSALGSYNGNNSDEYAWYISNEEGTAIANFNPVAFGNLVTATDLGITGELNGSFGFAVVHNTDRIEDIGYSGCESATSFFQVNVSVIPDPKFSFDGLTKGNQTTFSFFDPSDSQLGEGSLIFTVLDANNNTVIEHVSSDLDPFDFSFENQGVYKAILQLTSDNGCAETLERSFYILDKIQVEGLYVESFESNDGGWFTEFQSNDGLSGDIIEPFIQSSWEWGAPSNGSEPDIPLSGGADGTSNAWITNLDGTYAGGEQSTLYTNAYDLSALINPAVRFYSFRNLNDGKDGVVMQYSTDDGLTWKVVGGYDPQKEVPTTGQNWYTSNGIPSAPGDVSIGYKGGSIPNTGYNENAVGWTASDPEPQWRESIHALNFALEDDLKNVRFRFSLAASGASTDAKDGLGFGIDEFGFYELVKVPVVEHFTSTVSLSSKGVDNEIAQLINTNEIMLINYFTDLENGENGKDPVNAKNSKDPGGRTAYYGIADAPTSVLDGDQFESSNELNWNLDDINLKSLEPVTFDIENLVGTADNGILNVSGTFKSQLVEPQIMDLSFVFAVVEKEVVVNQSTGNIGLYQEGERLQNVLRIMLPNASGNNFIGLSHPGDEYEFEHSWVIDNVYDASQLRVIAFIQDNKTKQILQAGYIDTPGEEIITGVLDSDMKMLFYPNPTDGFINLYSETAIDKLEVLDISGSKVKQLSINSLNSVKLDVSGFADGIYFLMVNEGPKMIKFVVEH